MIQYINKFVFCILILLFIAPSATFAACDPKTESYCLLAPIGAQDKAEISDPGFSKYLQDTITLFIGLTAAVSVIMLIVGGLEYIFASVNEAAKSDAKLRVTNSIVGLLIALSGYLILSTINPAILNLGFPTIPIPLPENATPPAPKPPEKIPNPTAEQLECIARGLNRPGINKENISETYRISVEQTCYQNPKSYSDEREKKDSWWPW